MPGINDAEATHALHMSPFFRYKLAVGAVEPVPSGAVANIDLTGRPNALRSTLSVVVKRTSGVGGIKLAVYFQPSDGSPIANDWLLDRITDFLVPGTLHRINDLYAGKFRLVVAEIEDTGVFDVYVSQQDQQFPRDLI